ncbi:DUF6968 family protein [Azospirillum halopraeferens]|uniref:DUF6968 family protein n=1 Tax=Azospirillum halopraeferens TaxID=34010 RepID=UPI000491A885|nr:hypothetical protein [Azospirillum halopraeferens]
MRHGRRALRRATFEPGDAEVVARFSRPEPAPGGEYRCRWTLTWPDREQSRDAPGIDGVLALMHAMRSVHTELAESDAHRSGRLTFLHRADLDLPPTWGFGLLYTMNVPPSE